MVYHVYEIDGNVEIKGKFEKVTWLGFYEKNIPYSDTDHMRYIGTWEGDLPVKYPLTIGVRTITESDYYRG